LIIYLKLKWLKFKGVNKNFVSSNVIYVLEMLYYSWFRNQLLSKNIISRKKY